MNNRIKEVRKTLGLTLVEFSNRIGISNGALSRIETGINKPSERTLRLICSEFNVNRNWLDTSKGKMFVPQFEDDEIINEFLSSGTRESKIAAAMFREILQTPNGWEELAKAVKRMAAALEEIDRDDE